MSYTLYAHPKLPAIVSEVGADFHLSQDMDSFYKELLQLLDDAGRPVYYISNISNAKLNFGDIVAGMGAGATAGGVLRHPNLHEMILISASEIVKLGVRALAQAQYGGIKARLANTLDEALDFVQTESGKA